MFSSTPDNCAQAFSYPYKDAKGRTRKPRPDLVVSKRAKRRHGPKVKHLLKMRITSHILEIIAHYLDIYGEDGLFNKRKKCLNHLDLSTKAELFRRIYKKGVRLQRILDRYQPFLTRNDVKELQELVDSAWA